MEEIYVIVTNEKNGLSKQINVTDYSIEDFAKTCNSYAINFDVKIKRYNQGPQI